MVALECYSYTLMHNDTKIVSMMIRHSCIIHDIILQGAYIIIANIIMCEYACIVQG